MLKRIKIPPRFGKIGKIIYKCICSQIHTTRFSPHARFFCQVSSESKHICLLNLFTMHNLCHSPPLRMSMPSLMTYSNTTSMKFSFKHRFSQIFMLVFSLLHLGFSFDCCACLFDLISFKRL